MNVCKVTKYKNGTSKSNEWTDLYSFFKLNTSGLKNIKEYLNMEDEYIKYIKRFLLLIPSKTLEIRKCVDFRKDDWASEYLFTDHEKEINVNKKSYSVNEILTICRLMLRGVIVGRFNGDDCLIYVSENMYVYVGTELSEIKNHKWIPKDGRLFVKSHPFEWL